MNTILTAVLLLVVSFSSGLREPQRTGSSGSWKKMASEAPVRFRSTIGAVAAGNRLVVWGGEVGGDTAEQPVSDGAVYDIDTDVWKKMAPAPIEGREHFTMVATDHQVIIWGGEDNPLGAIYDVERDTWRKIADAPITLGMEPYTSGIIGTRLLVWGIGRTRELNPVGGLYDLARDTWQKMASPPPSLKAIDGWPPLFYGHTFIVWGCPNSENAAQYGAVYDTDTDRWKEMSAAPIERRNWPASVLVGRHLVIWGGCDGPVEAHTGTSRSDGAIYDIEANSWKKMSESPLGPRWAPRAFAWGEKVVIWGGMGPAGDEMKFFYFDGAIYDPRTDTWETIPEAPLASDQARRLRTYGIFGYNPTPPTLQGDRLIVWCHDCSAVYDLATRRWTPMAPAPISGRDYHVSLLFGDRLLIWGGRDDSATRSDGAICRIGR